MVSIQKQLTPQTMALYYKHILRQVTQHQGHYKLMINIFSLVHCVPNRLYFMLPILELTPGLSNQALNHQCQLRVLTPTLWIHLRVLRLLLPKPYFDTQMAAEWIVYWHFIQWTGNLDKFRNHKLETAKPITNDYMWAGGMLQILRWFFNFNDIGKIIKNASTV